MNYSPWPHQLEVYNQVKQNIDKGIRKQLIVIPTRGGKSWVAAKLIDDYMLFGSVYFVGHTNILLTQMSDELESHGIKHGIIAPWAPQIKYRVQVISKDSLIRRLQKLKALGWKDPLLIIIDECHMAMSATYLKVISNYEDSLLIGLTGSPCRLDNKPLGDIFDEIVIGPQRGYLIENGFLSPSDTFAAEFDVSGLRKTGADYNKKDIEEKCDKPKVLADIVKHWEELAQGKKTLTFCATIKHAHDMAEEFNQHGYPSIAISSKDSKAIIEEKLQAFYSGKYINLCSVNLFIMGFTIKECECIIQASPTMSLMKYLQMIGRGGIYVEDKVLINIDAVNNWERHGLPDEDRDWTGCLQGIEIRKLPDHKRCPECRRPVKKTVKECPHCGFLWKEREGDGVNRLPNQIEGKLVRITERPEARNDLTLEIARRAHNLKEAIKIAKQAGIAHQSAYHIWTHVLKNDPKEIIRI